VHTSTTDAKLPGHIAAAAAAAHIDQSYSPAGASITNRLLDFGSRKAGLNEHTRNHAYTTHITANDLIQIHGRFKGGGMGSTPEMLRRKCQEKPSGVYKIQETAWADGAPPRTPLAELAALPQIP